MSNNPTNKPISLDELLKTNQEQFARISAAQNQALDALTLSQRPPGAVAQQVKVTALPQVVEPETVSTPSARKPEPKTPTLAVRPTPTGQAQASPRRRLGFNTITQDLIETALINTRAEMAALLRHSALSPTIRALHEDAALITDAKGRMLSGQTGSCVAVLLREQPVAFRPGDVILLSDPYRCYGAVGHTNDWLVLVPIFTKDDDELIGFSSVSGPMPDVGGPTPGSKPSSVTSVFGEGFRIPPLKLYEQGQLNQALLALLLNNSRSPEFNQSDLMTLVSAAHIGEQRVIDLCQRFGKGGYQQACTALLGRSNRHMRRLISRYLLPEPQLFEDVVDDDGCGNGPFKLKLTVWREGEQAYFDWTGTSAQAPGPINFYLHKGLCRTLIARHMAQALKLDDDPAAQPEPPLFMNDGFHELIRLTLPAGSLLQPKFPAALGNHSPVLARLFEVITGALAKHSTLMAVAAGCGSKPQLMYSGETFTLTDSLAGGLPGRRQADGRDGYSQTTSVENLEHHYPLLLASYRSLPDSGGVGLQRGGNSIEKTYRLLESGHISIHDDRQRSQPWGSVGGKSAACSEKWLLRADGNRQALPAKVDQVKVEAGDSIIFRSAGGGGWGDPLMRDPTIVRDDVARGLVSADAARTHYGVVLVGNNTVDARATRELRSRMAKNG